MCLPLSSGPPCPMNSRDSDQLDVPLRIFDTCLESKTCTRSSQRKWCYAIFSAGLGCVVQESRGGGRSWRYSLPAVRAEFAVLVGPPAARVKPWVTVPAARVATTSQRPMPIRRGVRNMARRFGFGHGRGHSLLPTGAVSAGAPPT